MDMQLSIGGQPAITWDSDQHPHWPPVDGDGKLIGDLPWKFFDPEVRPPDCQGAGAWTEDGDCAKCGGNGVIPREAVTCCCGWPYGHCETCARVWGLTAVHVGADGTCAMYGHRAGDLT